MPKTSLAKFVGQIRKELLAEKQAKPRPDIPRNGGLSAKTAKTGGRKTSGPSGKQKQA
jgi:hypothetical protein